MSSNNTQDDNYWMQLAIKQAETAFELGEVPVGAILVDKHNQPIASAHNAPISRCDPTAHAEIQVLRSAAVELNNYRLIGTTLYVTLEPCAMCLGAMINARVKRLVFGADEPKTGAVKSQTRLLEDIRFNHQLEVCGGLMAETCSALMSQFFQQRREEKKK